MSPGVWPGEGAGTSVVLGPSALELLRGAARRRGCAVVEMLLAAFGRVLVRLEVREHVPITVVPSCNSLDGAVRQQRALSPMAGSHAMPLAMRMALSGDTVARVANDCERQGIAFRHERRWEGEDGLVRALGLKPGDAGSAPDVFGLTLEINEFDDRMVVDCRFPSAQNGEPTAAQILNVYECVLNEISLSSFDGA